MRIHAVLAVAFISLSFYQPASIASSPMTQQELEQIRQAPVVQHQTKIGVIVCRDPQIEFNENDWLADENNRRGGLLREHMLVDTLISKKLIGKEESFVDKLFPDQKVEAAGFSRYNVFASSSKCGDVPALILEAAFDKNHRLIRYRTRYYENGGQAPSIDSDWVE